VIGYAIRSAILHRRRLLAVALVAAVGTALAAGMAGILATGLSPAVRDGDRPFLVEFPLILGGWIVAIVFFAVTSTIGVMLEGRAREITGLRLLGADPGTIRRLLALEVTGVMAVGAVPGVLLGYLVGLVVVGRVAAVGLIAGSTAYAPGAAPLLAGLVVVVEGGIGGAVGARRLARAEPIAAAAAPASGHRPGRRTVAGVVVTVAGLAASLTTLTLDPDAIGATATTGPACVLVAVGLALLSPELLAATVAVLRRLPVAGGAPAVLARWNTMSAPERLRPLVMFFILFVGIGGGTLAMQGIENDAARGAGGGLESVLASINYLVVGLIAAFMAIALVNAVTASIGRRGAELAALGHLGATGSQVRAMLGIEAAIGLGVSAVVATAGAVAAVVPFAVLKTGSALSGLAAGPYLAVIAGGGALVLAVVLLAPGVRAGEPRGTE
jgi:putative ABC transport system permease protein